MLLRNVIVQIVKMRRVLAGTHDQLPRSPANSLGPAHSPEERTLGHGGILEQKRRDILTVEIQFGHFVSLASQVK